MRAAAAFALVAAAAAAQGQTYKWKDAAPSLPYELARAAKLHPVTLYTTGRCDACDQGRALLRSRGIPFAEKTVTTAEDREQLQRAGGKDELPLLVVGNRPVTGFTAGAWNEALDTASYPRRTMRPPGYRTGAVEENATGFSVLSAMRDGYAMLILPPAHARRPRAGGGPILRRRLRVQTWVPACAGTTDLFHSALI